MATIGKHKGVRLTDYKQILTMIEQVDPNNPQQLDEIDARVWCFINEKTYLRHTSSEGYDCYGKKNQTGIFIEEHTETDLSRRYVPYSHCEQYTRSRDAIKSIRPDGWYIQITTQQDGAYCVIWENIKSAYLTTPILPTEELAELHAIIQAIAYDTTR